MQIQNLVQRPAGKRRQKKSGHFKIKITLARTNSRLDGPTKFIFDNFVQARTLTPV